jgi:hypothetical protein
MPVLGEETMGSQGANQTGGPGDEAGSRVQCPSDAQGIRARTSGRRKIAAETRQGEDGDRDARPDEGHPSCAQQVAVRTRKIPKLTNGRHGFR